MPTRISCISFNRVIQYRNYPQNLPVPHHSCHSESMLRSQAKEIRKYVSLCQMYPPSCKSAFLPVSVPFLFTRKPDMVSPKVYSTNCAFKYISFPHVYFEFLKSIRASTCYQLVRLHRYIYNFLKKKKKLGEYQSSQVTRRGGLYLLSFSVLFY